MPGVDTVAVFVVDETEEQLVARHVSGSHAAHLEPLVMAVGERMSGWVAASGQAMMNAHAALDLFDLQAAALRSALAVPVDGPDGHRAVVALYSTRTDAFSSRHQCLVEAAVAHVTDLPASSQVIDILQSLPRTPRSIPASSRTVSLPRSHARAR
jgi:hypothetical protein